MHQIISKALPDGVKDEYTMSILRPLVMRVMMERKGNKKYAEKELKRNESVKKVVKKFGNDYVNVRLVELMNEYDTAMSVQQLVENHDECLKQALEMEADASAANAHQMSNNSSGSSGDAANTNTSTRFSSTDNIKTHVTTKPLHELEVITIKELVVGETHIGKKLEGALIVDACAMVGISTILFDGADAITLALYNFQSPSSTAGAQKLLPKGSRVVIKEPYCKILGSGIRGIRIDSPSDLVFLIDRPNISSVLPRIDDKEVAKELGNSEFKKGRYDSAIEAYTKALHCDLDLTIRALQGLAMSLSHSESEMAFCASCCAIALMPDPTIFCPLTIGITFALHDRAMAAYYAAMAEKELQTKPLLKDTWNKLNGPVDHTTASPCPLLSIVSDFLVLVARQKFDYSFQSSKPLSDILQSAHDYANDCQHEPATKHYRFVLSEIEARFKFTTIVLFYNRSIARLKVGHPFGALLDAFCASVLSVFCQKTMVFDNPKFVKSFFRLSVALLSIGDIFAADKALKLVEMAGNGSGEASSKEMIDYRVRLNSLIIQHKCGVAPEEIALSLTSDNIEIIDYVNAVEIRASKGKGRGLFATDAIRKGQIVMATRATAIADNQEKGVMTSIVNTQSKTISLNENLVAKVVQKVSESPILRLQIYSLCDGSSEQFLPTFDHARAMAWACPSLSNTIIDGARIRRILHLNSFEYHPQSESNSNLKDTALPTQMGARYTGLWLLPSFINHSSRKHNVTRRFVGEFLILTATRDIEKDEEILDQYFSLLENDLETIAHMKAKHNIVD